MDLEVRRPLEKTPEILPRRCTNRPSLSSKDEISRNKVGVPEGVPDLLWCKLARYLFMI